MFIYATLWTGAVIAVRGVVNEVGLATAQLIKSSLSFRITENRLSLIVSLRTTLTLRIFRSGIRDICRPYSEKYIRRDVMMNVLSWVFWLSLAVIMLSELKFWDVLRGEGQPKNKNDNESHDDGKDS